MTMILVFGTSTAYGLYDVEGGWVQRLRKYLDAKQLANDDLYFVVYNLGITGDTSRGMVERMESEIKSRAGDLDDGEELIILVSVGVNDSIIDNKSGKHSIPLDIFSSNVERMMAIAKKYSRKVIFIGNKPADQSRVDPIPWYIGHSYKEKFVEQYDGKVGEICRKNKISFVDVYSLFKKEKNWKKLLADGVHPTAEGHKLIFEIVRNWLVQHRVIP